MNSSRRNFTIITLGESILAASLALQTATSDGQAPADDFATVWRPAGPEGPAGAAGSAAAAPTAPQPGPGPEAGPSPPAAGAPPTW